MTETELKIALDAGGEAALRRNPLLAEARAEPKATRKLVSVYYDTPEARLAEAGVALRLRKVGRRWVQTVKSGKAGAVAGLFAHDEVERPAPGGRLNLAPDADAPIYREIAGLVNGGELRPVYETRVTRTIERLRAPGGGLVELAIDRGEVIAGAFSAPIREAELELVSGEVSAVYALARQLFTAGPIVFSAASKAERGQRLARTGEAEPPLAPRNAGRPQYGPKATVESVARDVFRDCYAQIATNMAVIAVSDDPEGPHQLRVGLRRLRSAFTVFRRLLGTDAFAPLGEEARRLGQAVSPLRDIDVLIDEVVAETAAHGLDAAARDALVADLETRRARIRREVRAALAAPGAVAFLFDLGAMIEARGWLEPSDYAQTERLATPVLAAAPAVLQKRLDRVLKRGRGIETLPPEALHELRKELKKLRYTVDIFLPIFPEKKASAYLKALKRMQETFGSLNDAAMASGHLTGENRPDPASPAAQRAVGWVLGALATRAERDRPAVSGEWRKLKKAKPFWG